MPSLASGEFIATNPVTERDVAVEVSGAVRRPGRFLRTALALALTAGLGGALVDCGGKSAPRPAAATRAQPKTEPSPSGSALPYGGSEPTLGGPYYSAKTYDPTVALAVPYLTGDRPSKALIETLFRDVDVATNLNDVEQLRYAGIYPSSEYAQNLQAGQMASYQSNRQQASALTHEFTQTFDDRDIRFDASNPYHAEVLVRSASDFDLKYAPNRVSYQLVVLDLGHRVMQLPNGQSEDIWNIQHATPNPATFDQWLTGYPQ